MPTRVQFPTAAAFIPAEHKLPILTAAMLRCEGCDLYLHATQTVPGAGASRARLMLVGEQPGNEEDKQGEPFVGPAGRILHSALDELHIKPADVYVTNAVKHFKYVQRGKLRLHKSPSISQTNACRPWLLAEIDAVKPRVLVCLGAIAAKSLLGAKFSLMRDHGRIQSSEYAERVLATIHPSAILRNRDPEDHAKLHKYLLDDLALAYAAATAKH